jgi:hypothetical protein
MDDESRFTTYRNVIFRSRLEARMAAFFDVVGIVWQYEPDVFRLASGANYIPDFYLKGIGHVEVKPTISYLDEKPKYKEFARYVSSLSDVPLDRTRYFGLASSVVHDRDVVSGRRTVVWLTLRSEIAGWRFIICPTCRKTTLAFPTEPLDQLLGVCNHVFIEEYGLRKPINESFDFVQKRWMRDGRSLSAAIIEALSGLTDDDGKRVIDVFDMVQHHNDDRGGEGARVHSLGLIPPDVEVRRRLLQNHLLQTPVDFSRGAKVVHVEFGDGTVEGRDVASKEILVKFFDDVRSIPLDDARSVMVNDWQ